MAGTASTTETIASVSNRKLDYAIGAHDAPQNFAEVFLYQLPYRHGRPFDQRVFISG